MCAAQLASRRRHGRSNAGQVDSDVSAADHRIDSLVEGEYRSESRPALAGPVEQDGAWTGRCESPDAAD
jgi:hypothetical protein